MPYRAGRGRSAWAAAAAGGGGGAGGEGEGEMEGVKEIEGVGEGEREGVEEKESVGEGDGVWDIEPWGPRNVQEHAPWGHEATRRVMKGLLAGGPAGLNGSNARYRERK